MVMLGREEELMMVQSHERCLKEACVSLPGQDTVVRYQLTMADGTSRITYGTGCHQIFNLVIEICAESDILERCRLTDIARDEESALRIMAKMVIGQVTPCTAHEIMEELLVER